MTVVELMNMALANIGVSNGLSATTDETLEAAQGVLHYDHALRLTLRRFPYPFATKFAGDHEGNNPFYLVGGPLWTEDASELTAVQAWSSNRTYRIGDVVRDAGVNYTAIAGNTNSQPPSAHWSTSADDYPESYNPDFRYAYRWPTDCLFARRLVNAEDYAAGRPPNNRVIRWRIQRDVNGLLICTNEPEAVLEYTAIDCANLYADDLFIRAFTWKLAELLAPTCTKNGKSTDDCLRMFVYYTREAQTVAMREAQQHQGTEASWIEVR